MTTAELIANPDVLPASIVEEAPVRPTAVLIKLLTDPTFALTAQKIHEKHGAAFTAFLLGEVNGDELELEKLEEAFQSCHLSSFDPWESGRRQFIEEIMKAIAKRSETDEEFKAKFDKDPVLAFRKFVDNMRFVKISTGTFVFVRGIRFTDCSS